MIEMEPVLQTYLPMIAAEQVTYHATHGHYVQGLITHSTLPGPATPKAADRMAERPTDQAARWQDIIAKYADSVPSEWRIALQIDVYEAPRGKGYAVTARALDGDGVEWTRTVNHGPETFREQDWGQRMESDIQTPR